MKVSTVFRRLSIVAASAGVCLIFIMIQRAIERTGTAEDLLQFFYGTIAIMFACWAGGAIARFWEIQD